MESVRAKKFIQIYSIEDPLTTRFFKNLHITSYISMMLRDYIVLRKLSFKYVN